MQAKVTVSKAGGKAGDSFSQSITLKDVSTIEEIQARVAVEFGGLFPKYQTLDKTPTKQSKAKKSEPAENPV